jgi:hypothetical protein
VFPILAKGLGPDDIAEEPVDSPVDGLDDNPDKLDIPRELLVLLELLNTDPGCPTLGVDVCTLKIESKSLNAAYLSPTDTKRAADDGGAPAAEVETIGPKFPTVDVVLVCCEA